ncbi:hypothetical protein KM043_003961 [Ampulex compressa]|nr:hypothetical protein KM043_003961 [Ampulex compressa]
MQLTDHHVPGSYRFARKLSFPWPKLTSWTAADWENPTEDISHWSASRYKRCFHGKPVSVVLLPTHCTLEE